MPGVEVRCAETCSGAVGCVWPHASRVCKCISRSSNPTLDRVEARTIVHGVQNTSLEPGLLLIPLALARHAMSGQAAILHADRSEGFRSRRSAAYRAAER